MSALVTSPFVLAGEAGISFAVKPRLCVLSQKEESCSDTLEIVWSAEKLASVCLFESRKTLPLRCWENELSGRYSVSIETGSDIEFQLREVDNKKLLVAELFEVIQDRQEFRKRRRNPWSFF